MYFWTLTFCGMLDKICRGLKTLPFRTRAQLSRRPERLGGIEIQREETSRYQELVNPTWKKMNSRKMSGPISIPVGWCKLFGDTKNADSTFIELMGNLRWSNHITWVAQWLCLQFLFTLDLYDPIWYLSLSLPGKVSWRQKHADFWTAPYLWVLYLCILPVWDKILGINLYQYWICTDLFLDHYSLNNIAEQLCE